MHLYTEQHNNCYAKCILAVTCTVCPSVCHNLVLSTDKSMLDHVVLRNRNSSNYKTNYR